MATKAGGDKEQTPAPVASTTPGTTTTVVSETEEVVVQQTRGAFRFISSAFKITRSTSVKAGSAKEAQASGSSASKPRLSKPPSESAKQALLLKSLIVGPTGPNAITVSKQQLGKINTQLAEAKKANEIISHLRTLSVGDDADDKAVGQPIHAVCLAYTEEEADKKHFSVLAAGTGADKGASTEAGKTRIPALVSPDLVSADLAALQNMWGNMQVVNLITTPGLGLGQPGDGSGLLAGAVPTASTIIAGINQITPQLMSIGFAAGKAIVVSHVGVYPPMDRISLFTYWWGLEIAIPPPSLTYLASAHSVYDTVINVLTAIALINEGVREIVPFVRYISQFVDVEFDAIRAQDRGKGVVCASTWIMPAALVPRPWDFPDPPPKAAAESSSAGDTKAAPATAAPATAAPAAATPAKKS